MSKDVKVETLSVFVLFSFCVTCRSRSNILEESGRSGRMQLEILIAL